MISRSPWKLGIVGLFALAASVTAIGLGYVPVIRAGTYGPGVAAVCHVDSGRLTTSIAGLLLVVTGQLAWLIRWARGRSLRDFRGGYRIWWWTAVAFAGGGVALLTDSHLAFEATAVWLAGESFDGLNVVYRFAPGLVAVVVLLPALLRDMRGCGTSRSLALTAVPLWLAGAGAMFAEMQIGEFLIGTDIALPAAVIAPGLLLAGTVAAFTSMLFHARHVIYESVEPPESPAPRERPAETASEEGEDEAAASSPKRRAARRSGKKVATKPRSTAEETPVEAVKSVPPEPPKPHFVLKEQVLKEPPQAVALEPSVGAVPAKVEPPRPEPVRPAPKAAKSTPTVAKSVPSEPEDESDGEDDGRHYRLDGAEDPLRGLSKRERRKLRKEMKHRDGEG